MNLPGRLDVTTLGDLLGQLYRERATGVLELVEWSGATAGRAHRVHVTNGLVGGVDSGLRVARLGEILESAGFIDSEAARLLTRRLAEMPHKRAGEILVEADLASHTAVTAALRHQLRRRLDALFSLSDVRVKFHVARPSRDDRLVVPLSPKEFLHGRPRHRDLAKTSRSRWSGGSDASRPWPPPGYESRVRSMPWPPPEYESRARSAPWGSSGTRAAPPRTRALQVLGLEAGADENTVRRAFRRLAAQVHPDRHPSASPGEVASLMKRFAELSAAYHHLVA